MGLLPENHGVNAGIYTDKGDGRHFCRIDMSCFYYIVKRTEACNKPGRCVRSALQAVNKMGRQAKNLDDNYGHPGTVKQPYITLFALILQCSDAGIGQVVPNAGNMGKHL